MSDVLGRIFYRGKLNTGEVLEIPMTNLTNGVYLLKVYNGKETLYQTKVICIK